MSDSSDSPTDSSGRLPLTARPAHLGWRLVAIVYDLLPLCALWFATSLVIYLIDGQQEVKPGSLGARVELVILWLVTGAYFVLSWRRGGHTLGMRAWRLQVLGADGRQASWKALWIRYAVAGASLLAFGLGFLWSLFDPEKRSWHDLASGTRFVRMDKA